MTSHPIIDRFVKCLGASHMIYDKFCEENDRAPTREECAMAATLFIEMNKQGGKAAGKQGGSPSGGVPACPKCGGDQYDNRDDKKGDRSPDFKCKVCSHPTWLTPPPGGKQAPKKQAPQGPINEPDDDPFDW